MFVSLINYIFGKNLFISIWKIGILVLDFILKYKINEKLISHRYGVTNDRPCKMWNGACKTLEFLDSLAHALH